MRVAIVKTVGKAIKRIAGTLEKVLEDLAGVLAPPAQAPVPVRVRIDR